VTRCIFVSDLHGSLDRYRKLIQTISEERPDAVFLGGDLLPSVASGGGGFVTDFLSTIFEKAKSELGARYPRVFLILGNDDPRSQEEAVLGAARQGLWEYMHRHRASLGDYTVYGYANIPPTPFLLKDWERYDVSRYVDPGCVPPDEGFRTKRCPELDLRYSTIQRDMDQLVGDASLDKAVFLFHVPPYKTKLDRADLDGKKIDHVPLDVHIGSIAVARFIESRQPLLTLHGHVHESARLTGAWRDSIGRTHLFSAAHDGPELALIRFSPEKPADATRELVL